MEAATTHSATTLRPAQRPATRTFSTALAAAAALLRGFARSCRDSRLPETPAGAGYSMLPRGEQERLLNRGHRPY